MITMFRNFARSKWAIGLLVLVAIALLFTGGTQMDVVGALSPPKVITAGDRSVDRNAFRQQIEQIRYQNQQQSGESPSLEALAADPGFMAAFRQRAQELGFLAWAENNGIRPGKELILRQIREIPGFFDPITQKFDETAYESRLAEARMTPEALEEQMRDEYVRVHYGTALSAGARLPRIFGAIVSNQTMQTRDGRWFTLTPTTAGTVPVPTDAQLTAFMQQTADQWRSPELRQASVIAFDNPTDGDGDISREQIEQRFNFRKDALSLPEKRDFVTLTAPNKETADRIAAALRAGEAPQAVATANRIQLAPFTDTPRTAIADPAVAAAVFGTAVNQVTNPVQARVGFVVARVSEITPGRPVTLADVEGQIVQELRETKAKGKLLERVTAFTDAREQGKPIDDLIRDIGARQITLPPLTREGRAATGQQVNLPPQLLEAINRLTAGGVSDAITLDQNQFVAVRVTSVTPAAVATLDQRRADVTRQWTAREATRLLSARADALMARLRKGEDIAAVAASVGATVTTRTGVRSDQETQTALGEGAFAGLFGGERGQPFMQQDQTGNVVIGRVDRIAAPPAALAAGDAQGWRGRLSQSIPQTFLETAFAAGGRRSKANFDVEQARLAMGLPAVAPNTPAGGAGGPTPPAGR